MAVEMSILQHDARSILNSEWKVGYVGIRALPVLEHEAVRIRRVEVSM